MEKDISYNLGFYIQRISRLITYRHNLMLEEQGITFSQFKVLLSLWEKDSKTQNEILEDLLCKPSTLSGLINILEKKELVKRTVDIYDARIRRIGLTEKGKSLEHVSIGIIDELEAELSKDLTSSEKTNVIAILNRVKMGFEGELEETD